MIKKQTDYLLQKYSENETFFNASFFLGGVLFDIFTLGEIDNLIGVLQQCGYLLFIGMILYLELIYRYTEIKPKYLKSVWPYKDFALHFLLGGLLSIYSLFFIKSASLFSSFGFIFFMLALLIGNELNVVQKQKVSLKFGLYFICLFSFFSMVYPVFLGYVGKIPFLLSTCSTALCIWMFYKLFSRKIESKSSLRKALLLPSTATLGIFFTFYFFGWIPPVPLSVKEIGVYHMIEKNESSEYLLYSETPEWKFWLSGDQNFKAGPEDKVFIFVRIFSPARFNDTLYLHWQTYVKNKWTSTDRIPIKISGGRKKGYRGYSYKENYSEGNWRVLVETNDKREVGRIHFEIAKTDTQVDPTLLEITKR